jgi:DNA-binding LacI/PurR family transcriptional regulator
MAGVFESFRKANLPIESEQVFYADFSESRAEEIVSQYLESTPQKACCTAFLCFSDIMALGVMRAIQKKGYSIPADFSVIGFDGLSVTEYTSPPLTTIAQDERGIGYEAASLLHSIMSSGKGDHRVMPYKLQLGGSVKVLR